MRKLWAVTSTGFLQSILNRSWLNIAKTNEAKSKIRSWFKKERREENIFEGRTALEREFRKHMMLL